MAGKNTSLGLHPSKVGHMVQDVVVSAETWRALEALAGCAFTEEKRQAIIDELTVIRDYRGYRQDQPTRQDVKRTLSAIAKLEPDAAIVAFNNCDQTTDMLIFEAAWFNLGVNLFECQDEVRAGKAIAEAAQHVLDNIDDHQGGRPAKGYQERLARYCCQLWSECGNAHSAYVWEENISPMVGFASILFRLVDNVESDKYSIRARLNSMREGFSP